MRLVHLTDPHLTTLDPVSFWSVRGKRRLGYLSWSRSRRYRHRLDTLEILTDAIHAEQADHIAVTGDLTHLGLPFEIEQAAAWLTELGSPQRVTLVPGNHDAYTKTSMADVHALWRDYLHLVDDEFPSVHNVGPMTLIGASSARPSPPFMADGKLGAEQRQRVACTLREHRGRFRCLLLHHPPTADATSRRRALSDARDVETTLVEEAPELVLHGHTHRNMTRTLADNVRIFGTASASCVDPRKPASYRLFELDPGPGGWTVTMTLKILGEGGRFDAAETTRWHTG